jgi:hypothetical protein
MLRFLGHKTGWLQIWGCKAALKRDFHSWVWARKIWVR